MVAIEPALARHRQTIVGGDYAPEDESGDAYLFTKALAQSCQDAGVEFRYGTTINRLLSEGGRIRGVELIRPDGHFETLSVDAYVVALDSASPFLMRPLEVSL